MADSNESDEQSKDCKIEELEMQLAVAREGLVVAREGLVVAMGLLHKNDMMMEHDFHVRSNDMRSVDQVWAVSSSILSTDRSASLEALLIGGRGVNELPTEFISDSFAHWLV